MHWNENTKFYLILIFVLLLTASLACNLPFIGESSSGKQRVSVTEEVTGNQGGSAGEPADEGLRCEGMDYPCSYADADPERISRSLEVMDLADQVYADEGNAVDVAQRLQQESDVVEMYYDERGVWYRVKGAPPMVFLHPEAFQIKENASLQHEDGTLGAGVLQKPMLPEPDGPVGENPPGKKARKRALFLAPFAWDFGTDVYDGIHPLLKETRDYRCPECVTLLATSDNPQDHVTDQNPTAGPSVEQFQNWEEYELIHVLAHGYQFCPGQSVTTSGQPVVSGNRDNIPDDTGGIVEGSEVREGECVTIIQTGHYRTEEAVRGSQRNISGVAWAYKPGEQTWGEVVTGDFFRSQYPEGLDDTIILFSSCQGLRGDDLAQSLIGTNTAVLGWTDYVFAGSRGEPVAVKLFKELLDHGLRISKAFEKTIDSSAHIQHRDDWYGARLVMKKDGDPRGREVVTLVHPAFREELEEGDSTVTQGVVKDGYEDHLYVAARIDGVDEEQTPEDFEVHINLDGEELPQTFNADSSKQVGEYSYMAQGAVELPYDVTNQENVALEAWADLPERGETRHVLDEVNPLGCGWNGSMSGVVSGEYKGLIMDYQDVSGTLESGELSDMLGGMGSMSGVSGMGELTSALGKVWLLTFDRSDQFVGMMAPEVGISSLPTLDTELLGYNTQSLSYQESGSGEKVISGTFSGNYHGLKLEGSEIKRLEGPTVQGEFVYNPGALCSMEVMMPILEHYDVEGPFGQ